MLLKWTILGCLYWPLLNAIFCGLFGNLIDIYLLKKITIVFIFLTTISSIYILILIGFNQYTVNIPLFICFDFFFSQNEYYNITWGLQFDALTVIILFIISCISFLVHIYTISYIITDPHLSRFFANLSLFTFFIIFLVTADNYIQLFVGWEGIGLCSYLLIGFWYTRTQANKSALQALIVNKIGDFTLLIAIITLFLLQGTTTFKITFSMAYWFQSFNIMIGFWSFSLGNFIGFLFIIGAIAKSAQIGLHTWLLSAIEGPTPVSALLHAATIVTAGIFLIIRSSFFWQTLPEILFIITICGAITAFFAATCGLVQHDIKKIIAFSTCSQLGYIFYACGLGEYSASLYHLTNHAFFKALLFLCAGAVIHALNGEQDLRRIGGLAQLIPITYIAILIASLSLLGFPFLSGFYSKDILIELAWSHYNISSIFTFWLATVAAIITAFYSIRLLYLIFLANSNIYKIITQQVCEADFIILFVFRLLLLGSILSGYFFQTIFISFGTDFFFNKIILNLLNNNLNYNYIDSEFLPSYIKLIPVFFSFVGILIAFIFYNNYKNSLFFIGRYQLKKKIIYQIYFFLIKKWFFDIIYNYYITHLIYKFGYMCYVFGDQGIFEWIGPQGLYKLLISISFNKQINTLIYLKWLIIGLIISFVYFFNLF